MNTNKWYLQITIWTYTWTKFNRNSNEEFIFTFAGSWYRCVVGGAGGGGGATSGAASGAGAVPGEVPSVE